MLGLKAGLLVVPSCVRLSLTSYHLSLVEAKTLNRTQSHYWQIFRLGFFGWLVLVNQLKWVWWHAPVIPALRRLRLKDQHLECPQPQYQRVCFGRTFLLDGGGTLSQLSEVREGRSLDFEANLVYR